MTKSSATIFSLTARKDGLAKTPRVAIIAAMARNRVIGRNNTLPWRLSADLQHFRRLTTGHPILMGRLTFESLGRPLPNRTNIIMTTNRAFTAPGCLIAHSLDEALSMAAPYVPNEHPEIFVIGGANLYGQALPRADRLYLTQVQAQVEGDAWFPEFDRQAWQELACEARVADEKNQYACAFVTLERKNLRGD